MGMVGLGHVLPFLDEFLLASNVQLTKRKEFEDMNVC